MKECSVILSVLLIAPWPGGSLAHIRDFYDWDREIADAGLRWIPRLVGDPNVIIHRNMTPCEEAQNMESNNNVGAILAQGRLFVSWRSSPLHFASADTVLHMVSSGDNGSSWDYETTVALGSDLREPVLVEQDDNIYFFFFQGGTNPVDFEPKGLFRMKRLRLGEWTAPELWGHEGEVVWEVVRENGTLYAQSYSGNYSLPGDGQELGQLSLFLNRSVDGIVWEPLGASPIYQGGLTEVGFHFDLDGNLWGVARNEDGDDSGWGSRVFTAAAGDLANLTFPHPESNPWIYESPKMFRHGGELYLVARTDEGGPFWTMDDIILNTLPAWEHHLADLVSYSLRQHGTAIWRLNRETAHVEKVLDLVGCGDTAFPSIVRRDKHSFIIFNYSSSIDETHCPPNWIMGQVSPAGSIIYYQEIEFIEG